MQTGNLAKWVDELQAAINNLKKKIDVAFKAVDGLPSFEVSNPEDGQFLLYDGSDSKWKNAGIDFGGFSVTPLIESTVTTAAQVELSADVADFDAILIEVAGGAGIHTMNTIPASHFVTNFPYNASASSANVLIGVDSSSYAQFKMGEADNKIYFFNLRNVSISNIYGLHY